MPDVDDDRRRMQTPEKPQRNAPRFPHFPFMKTLTLPLATVLALLPWLPAGAQWIAPGAKPNAVVAADGSGTHKTVQEAIAAAPAAGGTRFFIHVKPGTYKEKLLIAKDKGPITIHGDAAETTILTYSDSAGTLDASGKELGTSGSYSTKIEAREFAAENVTFENTHGTSGGKGNQAVALYLNSDRAVFRKCRFVGMQDTLYANGGRQYFEDCHIAGTVDYIFGGATAFFERCELHCVGKGVSITAASTPQQSPFGYVFSNCKITAEAPANWKTHLGRPWRPYASVTYLNTEMADVVISAGWDNWKNPENEKTARFAEYRSTGPGANPGARVPWSKQLTDEEAAAFAMEKVLAGSDHWNPKAAR